MSAPHDVAARLAEVRARIESAARRAGRAGGEVTLVGVTKRVPAERIAQAVHAGLRHLGESYLQEAQEKLPKLAAVLGGAAPADLRWHLVGRLQRNKAAAAAALFDLVESLDRLALAQALARHAQAQGRRLAVLLQVNLSGEPQKGGAAPEALPALLAGCAALPALEVRGLMTVPAASPDPEASRASFARLRALREDLRSAPGGAALCELSMGMSADFEVAVEEGATLVRVGTAIFGAREG